MNNKLLMFFVLIPLTILILDGCKRTRNNPYDPKSIEDNNNNNGNGNDTTTTITDYRAVLIEEFTSTG